MNTVTHTFTSDIEGPVGGGNYFMVTPDRLPITRVLSVTTEPGGPVDMDWVQMDATDSFVIIPRIITPESLPQDYQPKIIFPPDVRKAPRLAAMVEYETPEPETAQLAMPSARPPR